MPVAATRSASPGRAPKVRRDRTWATRSVSESFPVEGAVPERQRSGEHPATAKSSAADAQERSLSISGLLVRRTNETRYTLTSLTSNRSLYAHDTQAEEDRRAAHHALPLVQRQRRGSDHVLPVDIQEVEAAAHLVVRGTGTGR